MSFEFEVFEFEVFMSFEFKVFMVFMSFKFGVQELGVRVSGFGF